MIPAHVKYLIIGAGIHGLSTAYHLASQLKAKGQGGGADVLARMRADLALAGTLVEAG